MSLILEQFVAPQIGDATYLVGDSAAGVAAVIDPQVDFEHVLERARSHGVMVSDVVQTHVHEDFVSGATALAAAAGGARIRVSGHDAPRYGHRHEPVRDGDVIELGKVRLTVRHTPGHTPEHISLLVAQRQDGDDSPFAVFSGGSLLVGAAGRTDLLGGDRVDELTRAQHRTLHRFYASLDDGVVVWPTHVHGSPCGAAIGDRNLTTIGHERRHNPLLQHEDESSFREAALADLPPKPRHYPRIKAINTAAQPASGGLPALRGMDPRGFRDAIEGGNCQLVDTRAMLAFGGGHIDGAINIGASGHLAIWAGWMLDADREILLVADSDSALPQVLREFARTGFRLFAGYLVGGMPAWQKAGMPLRTTAQWDVHELRRQQRAGAQVIDVRQPHEWAGGHVPGARHVFLPELARRVGELDPDHPVAVYCDSGYRASIAASLLQSRGLFVANVPGSWQAWQAAGLPVEK